MEKWAKNIPNDAQPSVNQFLGPARVKPLYDNGLSSGKNSWMTQSNARLMSMELPAGQDDNYFANSTNASIVFTYADIGIPHAPRPNTSSSDTQTKASILEISDSKTYADYVKKKELDKMTEAHQAATIHANQIIVAQQVEIEQLKAQRLEDIAQRAHEEATETLKLEAVQLKLEIHELRRDLQEMIQQFKSVLATAVSSHDNEQTSSACADDNSPSEKRRDVRATLGKELFAEEMDLGDLHPYLVAMEYTDTPFLQK